MAFQWPEGLESAHCLDGNNKPHFIVRFYSDPTCPLFSGLQNSQVDGWALDGTAIPSRRGRATPLDPKFNLVAIFTQEETEAYNKAVNRVVDRVRDLELF